MTRNDKIHAERNRRAEQSAADRHAETAELLTRAHCGADLAYTIRLSDGRATRKHAATDARKAHRATGCAACAAHLKAEGERIAALPPKEKWYDRTTTCDRCDAEIEHDDEYCPACGAHYSEA